MTKCTGPCGSPRKQLTSNGPDAHTLPLKKRDGKGSKMPPASVDAPIAREAVLHQLRKFAHCHPRSDKLSQRRPIWRAGSRTLRMSVTQTGTRAAWSGGDLRNRKPHATREKNPDVLTFTHCPCHHVRDGRVAKQDGRRREEQENNLRKTRQRGCACADDDNASFCEMARVDDNGRNTSPNETYTRKTHSTRARHGHVSR